MSDDRVTVRQLAHETRKVFDRLQHDRRLVVVRDGRPIGILTAPDPDEQQLDDWAAAGEASPDWRADQEGLRSFLAAAPVRTAAAGDPVGSAAILADRAEDER
ncbi:hypothetical protein [Saccharopolyspora hattusasensis]|uniref:hypothetical protein n=1 Tax=Saccharopolyspora hattusasensis TaxID=1128679 RepID=UPI003D97BF7A